MNVSPRPPRRAVLALTAAALASAATACASRSAVPDQGSDAAPGAAPGQGQDSGSGLRVQPVVPSTDLAVGRNRFALGVLNIARGTTTPVPVPDAQLSLRFFFPIQPQPVARDEARPEFRYVDDRQKGLYVAQVQFDQPGTWGVEVKGTAGGRPLNTTRIQFTVKPKGDTPAIGAPAPRSKNLTRRDVDDIRKIDSGSTPNDMHELTIAEAIEQQKPLAILFASPGFCVTQTCAPELGEVQKLKAQYGQQANFIHVEIFKDPMSRTPYETVTEWGLTSEPWVFLVDRAGLVAEKFEGPAPVAELELALQRLL